MGNIGETVTILAVETSCDETAAAVVENGSWAPQAGRLMTELLSSMKNMTLLEGTVTLRSSVKEEQRQQLEDLADKIAAEILN